MGFMKKALPYAAGGVLGASLFKKDKKPPSPFVVQGQPGSLITDEMNRRNRNLY